MRESRFEIRESRRRGTEGGVGADSIRPEPVPMYAGGFGCSKPGSQNSELETRRSNLKAPLKEGGFVQSSTISQSGRA